MWFMGLFVNIGEMTIGPLDCRHTPHKPDWRRTSNTTVEGVIYEEPPPADSTWSQAIENAHADFTCAGRTSYALALWGFSSPEKECLQEDNFGPSV